MRETFLGREGDLICRTLIIFVEVNMIEDFLETGMADGCNAEFIVVSLNCMSRGFSDEVTSN